jgi:hypothetical protein
MCCTILLAGLALLQPSAAVAQVGANASLVAAAVTGEVSLTGLDGVEAPLRVGEKIPIGSVVSTGADGRTALSFGEHSGSDSRDLLLLGSDTTVELHPLGDALFRANVRHGTYRVALRSGPDAVAPITTTGDRTITLIEGDMLVTYDPDADDAAYMLRRGELRMEAGKRKIRLLSRMQRTVVGGRIRAATRIVGDEWEKAASVTEIEGVNTAIVRAPAPTTSEEEKAAAAKEVEERMERLRKNVASRDKPATPEPWAYDAEKDRYWNPEHGHWHPGKPPAGKGQGDSSASASAADLVFVRMTTTHGDIMLELDRGRAPVTVQNFLSYVDKGFYSGTVFHRVMQDFMI